MFQEHSHDFGTVARGTAPEHVFEIENCYEENITIAYVRSSCGCTKVELDKQVLRTWEKAQLKARFDGVNFSGSREATISVGFAEPFRAEVKLSVWGKILSDIQVHPSKLDFGTLSPGGSNRQTITVTRLNNPNFSIRDVKSTFQHVGVNIDPPARNHNSVTFRIHAWLKDTAPPGFVQNELNLIVSERPGQSDEIRIPVQFTGKILSHLEISPSILRLTDVVAGQTVTKRVVLKAKQPFRLKDVTSDNKAFSARSDDQERPVHFVEITYTAPEDVANCETELKFLTDLEAQPSVGMKATVTTASSANPGAVQGSGSDSSKPADGSGGDAPPGGATPPPDSSGGQ